MFCGFSDFFHGYPHTVPGFQDMAFWDIDVEPQGIRVVLRRVLGHQAVLVIIDVGDKFYLGFKFQNFCHDKK